MRTTTRSWLLTSLVATVTFGSAVARAEPPSPPPPPCPPGAYCEEVEIDGPEPPEAPEKAEPAEEAEGEGAVSPEDVPSPEPSASPPTNLEVHGNWMPAIEPPEPPEEKPAPMNFATKTGAVMFGATYFPSFIVGLVAAMAYENSPGIEGLIPLMIPVGGPLITAAIYEVDDVGWATLGGLGGVQAVGLIVLGIGASLDVDTSSQAVVAPTSNGLRIRF
jgi:hypothetical protein